jgi:sporulation and cell division protein SsgA
MNAPSFDVSTDVIAYQVCPDERVAVRVRMSWSPADPFVVEMRFDADHQKGPDPVWIVSRDLLVQGVIRPVGIGDVRVFPDSHDLLPEEIGLVLDNGQLHAEFWFDALELQLFLSNTLTRCPLGDETAWVDLDAEIAALLDDPSGPWSGPGEVIA